MQNITIFDFQSNSVRTITINGEPWFVANDVCRALETKNIGDALSRLDKDERDDIALTDTIGREQNYSIINESGMYSLVLTSRKEVAKPFKSWVTKEVLPAIRKTGKYNLVEQKPLSGIEMARENLRLWEDLEAQKMLIESQQITINQLDSEVGVLTEVVDQLFDYSSIIRVAKHNNVNPGCFAWHKLKAASKTLNLEIKSAPCDIWGTKNLYPHQAWQFVYPEYALPEASSLVLG